jgi:hypothetical protein
MEINHHTQKLEFQYESGNQKWISFKHLYSFYKHLYSHEKLRRNHFRNEDICLRVFGWKCWHAPGAAMFALLPHLDDNIYTNEEGDLFIKNSSSG